MIPNLSWRQVRQRRVALTEGLRLCFRSVRVSAILKPNMDDDTARHVAPYEVAMICDRTDDFLLQISARTKAEAVEIHDGLVAALRAANRHRTRRLHAATRRRRGRYGPRRG